MSYSDNQVHGFIILQVIERLAARDNFRLSGIIVKSFWHFPMFGLLWIIYIETTSCHVYTSPRKDQSACTSSLNVCRVATIIHAIHLPSDADNLGDWTVLLRLSQCRRIIPPRRALNRNRKELNCDSTPMMYGSSIPPKVSATHNCQPPTSESPLQLSILLDKAP